MTTGAATRRGVLVFGSGMAKIIPNPPPASQTPAPRVLFCYLVYRDLLWLFEDLAGILAPAPESGAGTGTAREAATPRPIDRR